MRKQIYYLLDLTGWEIALRGVLWGHESVIRLKRSWAKEEMMKMLILESEKSYNKIN